MVPTRPTKLQQRRTRLRIDVCETSRSLPTAVDEPAERHQPAKGNVRMTTFSSPRERPGSGSYWAKSSLSYAMGNCVEVADLPGGEIGVRNSRDTGGPVLRFTPDEWHAFIGGVRNGEFDRFGM